MSTAALVATRPLHGLQAHYDGLHGEYLSTRVTPIPGTDQGELLIVKRYQNTIKTEDDDEDVKPFGDIRSMVRAELEWRLFTEFRPMLPFLSDRHLISVLGHSVKLDRDVGSLDDGYLDAFNVPSTQKFRLAPEVTIESTPPPAAPAAQDRPVVKTEPERPGVSRRPRAQPLVSTGPAAPAAPVHAAPLVVKTEPERSGVRRRPRAQLLVNAELTAPLSEPLPVVKTERQDARLAHRVPRAQLLVNAEPSANTPRPTGEVAAPVPVPAARPTIKAESPVSSPAPLIQPDHLDAEESAEEETAPPPVSRPMVKAESPTSSPQPPIQADNMAMRQGVPAAGSSVQAETAESVEPPPRRSVKRRASDAERPSTRRMGLRSQRTGGG